MLFAQSKAAAPSLAELMQACGQGEEEKDSDGDADADRGGSSDEDAALFKDALSVYCGKPAAGSSTAGGPKAKAAAKGGKA
eukprot:9682110-Alexandrium_andersonii.AAC.1